MNKLQLSYRRIKQHKNLIMDGGKVLPTYLKIEKVSAIQMKNDFILSTNKGNEKGYAGDYVVNGKDGQKRVEKEDFEREHMLESKFANMFDLGLDQEEDNNYIEQFQNRIKNKNALHMIGE